MSLWLTHPSYSPTSHILYPVIYYSPSYIISPRLLCRSLLTNEGSYTTSPIMPNHLLYTTIYYTPSNTSPIIPPSYIIYSRLLYRSLLTNEGGLSRQEQVPRQNARAKKGERVAVERVVGRGVVGGMEPQALRCPPLVCLIIYTLSMNPLISSHHLYICPSS